MLFNFNDLQADIMTPLCKQNYTVLSFLLPWEFLFYFLLLSFPGVLLAAPANSPALDSSEINSSRIPDDSSAFTFVGLVEPGESLRIFLQPAESVEEIYIKEGQSVIKDQPLVQLINNTLTNAKFDLLQKQNQIRKEKQQLEISALEVKMKERQLNRIDEEIREESRLTAQIDGYISTVSKQLEEKKFMVTGELEILKTKLTKTQQADEQTDILQNMLSSQLKEVETRLQSLLIKAPFPGEVIFIAPDSLRTPPGGIVAELLGNSSFRVRGRVMQHQLEQVLIGEQVEVALDFSQEPALKGTVTAIQQSRMTPENRGGYPTFDVLVDVTDTAQWIRPGMMVSMKKTAAVNKD